jgi:hypothetical protein
VIGPNRRWLGGFVLAAALFPGSARAQELAQSFEDLRQTLKVGQRGAPANKGANDIAADRKKPTSRVRLLPLLSQAALSPTPLLGSFKGFASEVERLPRGAFGV